MNVSLRHFSWFADIAASFDGHINSITASKLALCYHTSDLNIIFLEFCVARIQAKVGRAPIKAILYYQAASGRSIVHLFLVLLGSEVIFSYVGQLVPVSRYHKYMPSAYTPDDADINPS